MRDINRFYVTLRGLESMVSILATQFQAMSSQVTMLVQELDEELKEAHENRTRSGQALRIVSNGKTTDR